MRANGSIVVFERNAEHGQGCIDLSAGREQLRDEYFAVAICHGESSTITR